MDRAKCVFFFAFKPEKARQKGLQDRAIINCEYTVAPFSGTDRKKRVKSDRCDSSLFGAI
jgi:ribonuclease PH